MCHNIDTTDLIAEVESIMGIKFEDLTRREIRGALMCLSALEAGMNIDAAIAEYAVLDTEGYGPEGTYGP